MRSSTARPWSPLRHAPLVACAALLSLLGGCQKGWDWREHATIECESYDGQSVSVHAVDGLPKGAVVEVAALPELNSTINNSGVYMNSASLLPLAVGTHTLTFEIRSGDESASTSCTVERPLFPAEAKPVLLDSQPFTRAELAYSLTTGGGEPERMRGPIALRPDGRFVLGFTASMPKAIVVDGAAVTANEQDTFEVPLRAELGAEAKISVTNVDDQTVELSVRLEEIRPWASDDTQALAGVESGFAWVTGRSEGTPADAPISAILVEGDSEVLRHVGPMRTLAELERVARVEFAEEVVEVCKYGTTDGLQATIDRVATTAKVALHDAKSGAKLASKTLRAKPPRCPNAADFTVLKFDDSDPGGAVGRRIAGEARPLVDEWFDEASQREYK